MANSIKKHIALNTIVNSDNANEMDAEELMELLKHYLIIVWSWGAEQFTKHAKFLMFKVSGQLHKGFVVITLNGKDLFDIHLYKSTWALKATIKDIYVDMLVHTLDELIETPGYKYPEL